MNDFIYINGRPVYMNGENEEHFELVDFAPDGQQIRYIVPKKYCEYSASGAITANDYELYFNRLEGM